MTAQPAEPARETIDDVATHSKPPYDGTRLRPIRIDDDLWDDAKAVAEALGTSVSEEVRDHLRKWVRKNRKALEEK